VAWSRVQRPKQLGGLGVMDMERLGIALRSSWLWLRRTDPDRPWAALPVSEDNATTTFSNTSARCVLGDGESLLFWSDPWWQGSSLSDLAPDLVAAIPLRSRKRRTIAQTLHANSWMRDR
jgi:hypothetical protein